MKLYPCGDVMLGEEEEEEEAGVTGHHLLSSSAALAQSGSGAQLDQRCVSALRRRHRPERLIAVETRLRGESRTGGCVCVWGGVLPAGASERS